MAFLRKTLKYWSSVAYLRKILPQLVSVGSLNTNKFTHHATTEYQRASLRNLHTENYTLATLHATKNVVSVITVSNLSSKERVELCYYPHAFLKKRQGYCNRLRLSVTLSPPKPLDEIQPNLVCELLTWMGRATAHFFRPAPLGLGEGPKGQISLNIITSITKSISKIF